MNKIEAGTDVRAVVENHRILANKLATGAVLTADEVRYLVSHYHVERLKGGNGQDRNRQVVTLVELDGEYYALDWTYNDPDTWVDSVFPAQIARKMIRQEKTVEKTVTKTVVEYVEGEQSALYAPSKLSAAWTSTQWLPNTTRWSTRWAPALS